MLMTKITQRDVIASAGNLPSFPRIVTEILASLDDPDSNLNDLSSFIAHDPVITAKVLSQANLAATHSRNRAAIRDIYTATSLIGMSRVREIVLITSMSEFLDIGGQKHLPASYWEHSVSVAVCAQELAMHISTPISSDTALIAGLLHDIGQLWLYRFHQDAFAATRAYAQQQAMAIELAEREYFGVDHAQIGAWLAEYWQLPTGIAAAIACHHRAESALNNLLALVVNMAEVLSNALDLGGRNDNRVTTLSSAACRALNLRFDDSIQPLLGRIEARSTHANKIFSRHDG